MAWEIDLSVRRNQLSPLLKNTDHSLDRLALAKRVKACLYTILCDQKNRQCLSVGERVGAGNTRCIQMYFCLSRYWVCVFPAQSRSPTDKRNWFIVHERYETTQCIFYKSDGHRCRTCSNSQNMSKFALTVPVHVLTTNILVIKIKDSLGNW
jgi:hypothetical protein